MDRRKFLGVASFAGLSVATLPGLARAGVRRGLSISESYRCPLFLTINARGGWDPSMLCDPKGARSDTDTDAVNFSYRARDIGRTASGIRYAPLAGFHRFFEKYGERLLVINGIDVGT